MEKILQYLGGLNPLVFAIFYFLGTFLAAFLIYYLPCFELSSSLDKVELTSFLTSLYFSFTTITTLGYGDITPANQTTRFLVIALAFNGILLTGLFLNSLAYRVSLITQKRDQIRFEEDQKKEEIRRFLNITPILFQNFRDFISITYCLVTPQDQRSPSTKVEKVMTLDFKLNDFRDMYKPSFLRKYSFYKSSIEVFYPIHDRLKQNLEDFLKLGYLSFDKDLMDKVIKFLAVFNDLDSREHVLAPIANRKEMESVISLLVSAEEPYKITEIANVKDAYIQLYSQIQLTVTLIKEIEECVNDVNTKLKIS